MLLFRLFGVAAEMIENRPRFDVSACRFAYSSFVIEKRGRFFLNVILKRPLL